MPIVLDITDATFFILVIARTGDLKRAAGLSSVMMILRRLLVYGEAAYSMSFRWFGGSMIPFSDEESEVL